MISLEALQCGHEERVIELNLDSMARQPKLRLKLSVTYRHNSIKLAGISFHNGPRVKFSLGVFVVGGLFCTGQVTQLCGSNSKESRS